MPYYAQLEPVAYALRIYADRKSPPRDPFVASGTVTVGTDRVGSIRGFCMDGGYCPDVWRAVNDAFAREGLKAALFDRRKPSGVVRMVRVPVQYTRG